MIRYGHIKIVIVTNVSSLKWSVM